MKLKNIQSKVSPRVWMGWSLLKEATKYKDRRYNMSKQGTVDKRDGGNICQTGI